MTPDQQARERLAREATPGPWDWRSTESLNAIPGPDGRHYGPRVLSATYEYDTGADIKVSEADMAHIAANSPSVILADLARLRALEDEKRDLGAQLYAATERVQHLLTTIDVERTGRKEAAEEVARLNAMRTHCEHCGADYMATGVEAGCPCRLAEEVARLQGALEEAETIIDICEHRPPGGQQVTPPPYNMTPYTRKVLQRILRAALHAQDTEVGR